MAKGATIYKCQIELADAVTNNYQSSELVVAQHPSETELRMLARILAYSLNLDEGLKIGKGLCNADEPEMWVEALHGDITHWIEVGQPSGDRIRKALRKAPKVTVYSYQSRNDQWLAKLDVPAAMQNKLTIYQIDGDQLQQAQALIKRQMSLSISRFDDMLYVADDAASFEVGMCEV